MKLTISSLLLTLCLLTSTATSTELNTGNILSNSTFGTGNTTTTTGWSTDGDEGVHTHGAWNGFPYQTGMDDSGGVLAFEGHTEDNVYQDVDLVDDGHLTQQQMNQGFTSTMGADVWFWNNIENTLTLKQTITGADGSVSTQIREITGTSTTDGNTFTNYTNVHIQGSNTQTDITIRAELFNETAGTAYDDSHRGPDVDNVTLDVTYQDIPPINEDTQEVIDNIENNIPDIPEDIFEEPEFIFEEEYFTWEDDFYFDDSFTMEDDFSVYEMPEEFQIIEMPEEFEDMVMDMPDEMPDMEMPADMEDAFTIVSDEMPEMEMTEEMEEEFVEMVEDDMPEMEDMQEEPTTMEMAEEETVDMEMETEEDTMEMPKEEAEEMEVAENDDTMEEPKKDEEPSESADETLEEESGSKEGLSKTAANEEEAVGDTDVADKGGIKTKNIEVSKNIKIKNVDVGEIKITVNPKDIFNEVVSLDSYEGKDFYKDDGLKYKVNDDFFEQASMIQYNKEIYTNVTLIAYIQTDPVTVYKQEMEELAIQKAGIMIELKLLRGN
jgi:hypothetical protein